MRTRSDAFYDVLTGQDLHDHEFYLAHYHPTDHVSLTIPLSHHGHRTLHLAPSQCQTLGHHLLRFARTRQLTEPQTPEDFQI
jgi:hypothetical protein